LIVIRCKKGVLIALLFFILNSSFAGVQSAPNRWYQTAYDYLLEGRNEDAFNWMLRAAQANHSAAQNNIGLSYLHGLGAKKDNAKAFIWFKRSAEQGLSYAQSELAMLYYQGRGVQKNIQKAYDWWLIAAKQEDEYAQFNLASLLLEKNKLKQAHYWFNQAVKNNHPSAKEALKKLEDTYVE
jgi:TPR repeat protein